MRAGEFARKHQISTSTLAYYVKQGLLLPAMAGGKYDFGDADDAAMEMVAELKQWQFSLEEIAVILSYMRLARDSVYPETEKLVLQLQQQRRRLVERQKSMEVSIASLDMALASMQVPKQGAPLRKSGVDVRFLPYFYCPDCGAPLTVHLETIDAGIIYEARLSCSCGYAGTIENGIVINGSKGPGPEPYRLVNYPDNQALPPIIRNMVYQVNNHLLALLNREPLDNKIVLETHISTSSFILQKARAISPNALYYLCDPQLQNISQEKKRIEESGSNLRICHIASNYHYFPIQPNSADVIIDCFINVYFSASSSGYMFPHWKRYLRTRGKIIGVFTAFKAGSKSARQYKALYPPASPDAFDFDAFKAALAGHGFSVTDEHIVGPITQSHFAWHVPGDELFFCCYCAELGQ